MIRRKYMRTRQLKPGMKIDQSVEDRLGRSLVSSGAILDDYIIQSLLKLGIMNVYIRIEIDDNDLLLPRKILTGFLLMTVPK